MGRKIPNWQVGCVVLFAILMLCYAMNIFGQIFGEAFECGYEELSIPLAIGACVAALVSIANGFKWSFLERGIVSQISRSLQAILVLMIVGCLVGSWIAAGVVPTMIYYGLMILNPTIFLFAACIICGIVALSTGTSWGTAGTVGIALMGVGMGLGINPALAAGAVVSGAYFGDKLSPLSDTTNLAPAIAGSNLFEHIRHMLYVAVPGAVLALLLYLVLGFGDHGDSADMTAIGGLMDGIADTFTISPVLLLPPLVVIVIVALKLPALPGLAGGVLLGCIFGGIFQGVPLSEWFGILHYGYEFEISEAVLAGGDEAAIGVQEELEYLLSRGGMDSMMWTINLIICAMCFGGVLDASGMLATLANGMLKLAKNTGSLVTVTIFSCLFMNIIASDQYLAIILPGRMYKEAFEDMRLKNKNLSRCLENSGTLTSPLIPWNTCGATMGTFLGISALQYNRFAFFNWMVPIISIIFGFVGYSMHKMTEEEYQKVLDEREEEKKAALAALEG